MMGMALRGCTARSGGRQGDPSAAQLYVGAQYLVLEQRQDEATDAAEARVLEVRDPWTEAWIHAYMVVSLLILVTEP